MNSVNETPKETACQDAKSDSQGLLNTYEESEGLQKEIRKEIKAKVADRNEEKEVPATTSQSEDTREDVDSSQKIQVQDAK